MTRISIERRQEIELKRKREGWRNWAYVWFGTKIFTVMFGLLMYWFAADAFRQAFWILFLVDWAATFALFLCLIKK
jgi:uncharacterized membrane protein